MADLNNSNVGKQPMFTAANASEGDDVMDFSDLFFEYYEHGGDGSQKHDGNSSFLRSSADRNLISMTQGTNFHPGLPVNRKPKIGVKRDLTEEQRLERRERNREHAKRSRIRKRFMLESLQEKFMVLQKENMALRQLIQDKIPDKAEAIFEKCTNKISDLISTPVKDYQALRFLIEPDFRLVESLTTSQQNFTVSDPSLPDNPIVYASQGFLDLTGYRMDQILGRNCRFLQGPGTDPKAVEIIRKGVAEGRDMSVCLLNYKADGTPFWNQFFVAPLRDANDQIVNFVGVQCEVKEMSSDQLRDTLKKMPLPDDS
mmetsp:Transcript_1009/g.1285  ORF Transcript_1009/g.1285 Transcript_1009/m.1285 type:complete len:314 (-) Transcript_1009:449-1390(-)|eukprot:CAMPEP_0117762420 /NCGR_PEP_ID=MMETSP0947-20121206/17925_1 /TAXON_ID=44440 /ORGANISM="Chattonella subsalsa, Strain CCMP2191" /LENGTH=313 /DNA_ID=CAMNT_0005583719 /DNA_START=84 /DNA_END=1025 /DNA_ORIENTATION=+